MTGMWPNPVQEQQQHMQHGQHVPVSYASGYQQAVPVDVYGAAAAGMVPGWTAAQRQYGTSLSHQQQQQQHMYQTAHMAGGGHAMHVGPPHMMQPMGHHVHHVHHGGMQHQAGGHGRATAAVAGIMPQPWFGASGQHLQQPAMVQGSPPPGSRGGWSAGGTKAGAPFGSGGFSNNRPFYGGGGRQQQGGRGGGGRARRHIVLNTDPGALRFVVLLWLAGWLAGAACLVAEWHAQPCRLLTL
jgi:hypothetical protein